MSYSDGCQEDGKICDTDAVQIDLDEKCVANDADNQSNCHVQATFAEAVGRVADQREKQGGNKGRGHGVLDE